MKRNALRLVTLTLILCLCSCSLDKSAIDAIHEHYDGGKYSFDCPEPSLEDCPVCEPCKKSVMPTVEDRLQDIPPIATPVPQPIVETPETIVEGFGGGTLWKPVAEHNPNLVVLLRKGYSKTFDRCFVYREGREDDLECKGWSDERKRWTPGVCFSNGDRQTWRADFTCDKADEVKIVCKRGAKTVIFQKPGADVCGRHE